MNIILDILVVLAILFCAWNGWRRGLIAGVLAILFIFLSAWGANIAASGFSQEFSTAIRPFADGYLSSIETEVAETMTPAGMSTVSITDLIRMDPANEEEIAREMFVYAGVHETRIDEMVEAYMRQPTGQISFTQAMINVLSETLSFIAVYFIVFTLLLIALTVAFNLIPFTMRIPRLKWVDRIGGGVLALVQVLMIFFMIGMAVSFLSILIPYNPDPEEMNAFHRLMENSFFLNFFTRNSPLQGLMTL